MTQIWLLTRVVGLEANPGSASADWDNILAWWVNVVLGTVVLNNVECVLNEN